MNQAESKETDNLMELIDKVIVEAVYEGMNMNNYNHRHWVLDQIRERMQKAEEVPGLNKGDTFTVIVRKEDFDHQRILKEIEHENTTGRG